MHSNHYRKVAIITQARTASARLPFKVLKTIKGKSLLFYHVRRAQWSTLPIIVATTINSHDDQITAECESLKIPYFRGEEDNVLNRYYHCAKEYKLETIIRITADCPLIDGNLIRNGYETYKKSNIDYLSNTIKRTFPRGLDFEIFTFKALEEAFLNAKEISEKEHVTPYIWKNVSKFKIKNFGSLTDRSNYRITVDTVLDFTLIKTLIDDYSANDLTYEEIIGILDNNPRLVCINKGVLQKKV